MTTQSYKPAANNSSGEVGRRFYAGYRTPQMFLGQAIPLRAINPVMANYQVPSARIISVGTRESPRLAADSQIVFVSFKNDEMIPFVDAYRSTPSLNIGGGRWSHFAKALVAPQNQPAHSDRMLRVDRTAGEYQAVDDVFSFILQERHHRIQRVETPPASVLPELADALTDLNEIVVESEEKGFEVPSESACQLAEQLLRTMYAISPRRFEIYPMPNGEIAIDGHDSQRRRIIVFCGASGGIRCLTNADGKRDSYSDSSPHGMMGSFIQGALEAFL